MSKKHSLFSYERGLLLDHIIDRTGINNLNLINSKYLIDNNILRFRGDFPYLISNIRARKTAESIKQINMDYFQDADELLKQLGIKQPKLHDFDTYYGILIRYSWHKGIAESGSGYSPIYHLINELKNKKSDKEEQLNFIYRRLNYIEVIFDELYYLSEKFDYDVISILLEWTNNKFETFTTIATELALIIIDFYYDIHPKLESKTKEDLYFENMFNLLREASQFFNTPNDAFYCLLLIELRNRIVHKEGHSLIRENNKIFIQFEIEMNGKIKYYDILQDWLLKNVIPSYTIKKKKPYNWYDLPDPHFKFVLWNIRMQKNGSFNTDDPRIKIKIELKEFVDIMNKFFIYQVCNRLFRNLLQAV